MRYSKQREIILNALKSNPIHPTADYVYNSLKKDNPSLSLGTVYRNLNLLSDIGVIRKIRGMGNSEHFDYNTHNHAHFICAKCSRIFDIDIDGNFYEILNLIAKKNGLDIEPGGLVLKGMCKNCKKDKNKERKQ
ncbi:Ferric uptake regulator [Elusimicrobium minutum Pei191]|uniref:Ferric uptake regulator n=1 Tax=Elusimicrobium minutum (strain Pei191) TaxID=445932 RepID=B2KDJ4_ELUMP|nr:transcriptional repressor [Elusimicrobium minutum]ACC98590.1 Ferric uptake regulator [Elusimicrobium minutum Pei191]